MTKEHINPPELFPSLQYGFSQIVTSTGGKTVYLSGQVAWNANRQIVGAGDLGIQTRAALKNITTALTIAGGSITDVVSMRIYIVEDVLAEDHHVGAALREFFPPEHAPATTWIGVRALANKDFLVEIEAVAVIEEQT
ncbi:MAG: RidA family protein [Caldilineaceae bacterium]|nr:RidA family protein [Caldilineaceae bacterium]MCB0121694.1 RidA family protein [Caldilineaceae bacterium]